MAEEFKKHVTGPEPSYRLSNEIELNYHGLLLQMSGNTIVSGLSEVLLRYFQKKAENRSECLTINRQIALKHAFEHEAIADGFKRRDTEMTRSYLRGHLEVLLKI